MVSDTFLIIGEDDSAESFAQVEYMSRLFAGSLLGIHVPLRGAIACDRFYADLGERTFFGRALVEAYRTGESQDWIGLLLCPSAERRLDGMSTPSSLSRYWRKVVVPSKESSPRLDSMYACLLGSWTHVNGQNPLIDALKTMRARCTDERAAMKHERTIAFLESSTSRNG